MTESTQLKLALLCVILAPAIRALPALHLLMGVAVGYVLMSVALWLVAAVLYDCYDAWRYSRKGMMTTKDVEIERLNRIIAFHEARIAWLTLAPLTVIQEGGEVGQAGCAQLCLPQRKPKGIALTAPT